MEILPSAAVAPEVTDPTISSRSLTEYPERVISPRPAVAQLVMLSIASPRDDTVKPVI